MNGSWFFEENFNGLSDDFFDDVIKYLDLPLEDVETENAGEDWNASFEKLEQPPIDMLSSLSSEVGAGFVNGKASIHKGPHNSQHSSSSEASFSGKSSIHQHIDSKKVSRLFQSSSPVSVLENNSSLSPENRMSYRLVSFVKGIRSKRKRATTFKPFPFTPKATVSEKQLSAPVESESESYPAEKPSKKKWKKQKNLASFSVSSSETQSEDGAIRKCMHCETTKTPQWREGPAGPKTLCNACGVRFRSGRLVPEYRPAASPTFIPSVHSNSHRKIVEMRKKGGQQFDPAMMHAVTSSA